MRVRPAMKKVISMSHRSKPHELAFGLIVLSFLTACVQQDDSERLANEVANQFLAESGLPGIAISVGIDDSIIWSEGFGFADVEQQVPVSPAITLLRDSGRAANQHDVGRQQ